MKRQLLYAGLFWASLLEVFAQPVIQWQKSYGGGLWDEASSICQTSDGGYIVAGETPSATGDVVGNHGGFDYWVLKLDSIGNIQWKKTFGGSDNDTPTTILPTTENGFIVSGTSRSNDYDVWGNHGEEDVWIVKITTNGDIEWQRCYGGSFTETSEDIIQTVDGGYIFTGSASSNDGDVSGVHGTYVDVWVVKIASDGEIVWQKTYGGTGADEGYAIRQTSDMGYIVTGRTYLSNDGDVFGCPGGVDYWVLKIDSMGQFQWQSCLGGLGIDAPYDIVQIQDDGYAVIGSTWSGNTGDVSGVHGDMEAWLLRLDSVGNLLWQRPLGGTLREWGFKIYQKGNGNFIVIGHAESSDGDVAGDTRGGFDAWLVEVDETGNIVWQKTYGGSDVEFCEAGGLTSDGGYILGASNRSADGDASSCQGYSDFWIVKLSPETVSTQAPSVQPLEIFPNPAEQQITLNAPTLGRLQVRLTDLLGRQLLAKTIAPNEAMDISALPPAVYLLSATDEDGRVFAGKVIKE